MTSLYHYPLDPFCRRVRLSAGEYKQDLELIEEKPWQAREDFLQLNPIGAVPVLVSGDVVAAGIEAVAGYIEDHRPEGVSSHIGNGDKERAEVRRLTSWFDTKFHHEVSAPLLVEKVIRRFVSPEAGGGAPNMNVVRQSLDLVRPHLEYIGALTEDRNWLAGDEISNADFAAAAHLSVIDYLGDVPWSENEKATLWYQRIKSRPTFRTLLGDKVTGMPASRTYTDLDF